MELSSQEGEMPIPLNSTYGGGGGGVPPPHGHMIHHHDPAVSTTTTNPQNNNNHIIIPSNNNDNGLNSPVNIEDDDHHQHHVPYKKMVRYRECLKNHAASMGGNATDGCGEFMPSGEEGTLEALNCSACNCHRNFHRKEIEGESVHHLHSHPHPHHPSSCDCFHNSPHLSRIGSSRKVLVGHHHHHHPKAILGPGESLGGYSGGGGTLIPSRGVVPPPPPPHPFIMSYNMGSLPSESDEQEEAGGGSGGGGIFTRQPQLIKKRFRTKFTQEQKEKMLNFAEKVGWKIQKQEEAVVQQFCQEVGVKRRVLKVWMHNNKHNLAKKNSNIIVQNQVIQES